MRCLALVAVVVGLLGMHALTGGHGPGAHATLPPTSSAIVPGDVHVAHGSAHTGPTAAVEVVITAVEAAGDQEQAGTVGCALFLAAVGVALLVALERHAFSSGHPVLPALRRGWVPSRRHRGPPPWAWPHFALCVMRT